jgi:PTS system galactitol-specific IIC component
MVALICAATKGNIVRSFIIGIPIVAIHLYTASNMASLYTKLAAAVNYKLENYTGTFTSFLDGGNVIRVWIVKLFTGNIYALLLLPVFLLGLYFTCRIARKDSKADNTPK